VDWPEIAQILSNVGYNGPCLVEVLPGNTLHEVEQALCTTQLYLQPLLNQDKPDVMWSAF
jgi:sugar phosphate isomerase/epimerase